MHFFHDVGFNLNGFVNSSHIIMMIKRGFYSNKLKNLGNVLSYLNYGYIQICD